MHEKSSLHKQREKPTSQCPEIVYVCTILIFLKRVVCCVQTQANPITLLIFYSKTRNVIIKGYLGGYQLALISGDPQFHGMRVKVGRLRQRKLFFIYVGC